MKTIEAEAENDDEEKTKEKGEPPASSSPLSPVQRGTLSSCSSSITSPWPAVKEFLWLRARQLFRTSGRLLATLAMALIILALYGLGNSDVAQILKGAACGYFDLDCEFEVESYEGKKRSRVRTRSSVMG